MFACEAWNIQPLPIRVWKVFIPSLVKIIQPPNFQDPFSTSIKLQVPNCRLQSDKHIENKKRNIFTMLCMG